LGVKEESRVRGFGRAIVAVIFILIVVSGCSKTGEISLFQGMVTPFESFRDIPGVTAEEIAAIESLQKEYEYFIFGGNLTTEAFFTEDGEIGGFSALFCEWLSSLFGIRFKPEIYAWNEMLAKFNAGAVHFIGSLTATEERKKTYYMTDSIAERQFKMMRLIGSLDLDRIAAERLPRYAFLEGSNIATIVASATEPGSYETIRVNDIEEAHRDLEDGIIDAFIGGSVTVDFFFADNIYTEDFYPLIFSPVSMATAKATLAPIISIVDKALRNGAIQYLNTIYNQGYEEYRKYRFISHLNDEEKEYLRKTVTVPLVYPYFTYPIAFYDTRSKKWDGIGLEVLREVEKFSGLKFKIINDEHADIPELIAMLSDGRGHIFCDLIFTKEREPHFIWNKNTIMTDQYALLSKIDFPNVNINEIPYTRIALIRSTAHEEMFQTWCPNAVYATEYANVEDAFLALEQGKVDMVMAGKNKLLHYANYFEFSGYKANYPFNYYYESTFAYNNDQAILCSILDKAISVINTYVIKEQWVTKTYDYRTMLTMAQRPWLIGAAALSLVIISLVLIMFYRSRNEEKRLVKLVTEKTSTLSAIFDATPDIIFCKNLDSLTTECNKASEIYFNVPKKDIIGKPDTEALGWTPDIYRKRTTEDKKVMNERQMLVVEEYIQCANGEQRLFETIKTPLIQDGEVTGLVGMSRDITQRKAAEEEAKNASEAKSRFVANMSHEMRTPMNVIVGLTDLMLEEEDIPVNIKGTLKKINTAGNTLMGLINDVLDNSKVEAGKVELMPVQYEVASLLNDIIILNIIRIEEKPIVFKLDINEELPCTLFGDDLRVKQILNNLLSNAFKYTNEGTVTLGIDCRRDGRRQGDTVSIYFTVSDTGIGIHKEDITKLFSDYNQLDTRANRKIEATGLGLSITKKFVELMDGEISVESEYGKGTVFRAHIRQGLVDDKTIGRKTVESLRSFHLSEKKKLVQQKLVRSDLSYASVLVVDDLPTNLDVAAGMLRKYKMRVECVTSGQEAVNRIAAGEPLYDAIFMDHMMPGMDGIEATIAIRALGTKYSENIPIIALTANVVAGNEQMFLDNGFNAFLPKPFNVMILDSMIQRWVRDKSRE
jgi:PAS domain S-box-containing protein